jgi:hypothetical protein
VRSRDFNRGNRQAVRLTGMPTLRLTNELTVSAWYRSGALPAGQTGEEIVSAGNSYLLRVGNAQINFSKRVAGAFSPCVANFPQANDNQWHHVVGTNSASSGMRVFVDGAELMSCPAATGSIVYDQGNDLYVGRHGGTQTNWDFDGQIDDVRIYGRALDDGQISAVYLGQE